MLAKRYLVKFFSSFDLRPKHREISVIVPDVTMSQLENISLRSWRFRWGLVAHGGATKTRKRLHSSRVFAICLFVFVVLSQNTKSQRNRQLRRLKPATHLAILYADRRDRRKSPGVPGAAIAIFADRRDRRIKSPISCMSDIDD